jgi:hypothetical protein
MPNPTALINGNGMAQDTPVDDGGDGYLKLAVGSKVVAGADAAGAWQGAATHVDGEAFEAADGVVLVAGYDAVGDAIIKLRADSNGKLMGSAGKLAHGGMQMTAGAREAITTTPTPCSGALVKAYDDNAATIWVGGSLVTAGKTSTGGYPLEPGESVGVPCEDAADIYVIGSGTDGVAWFASAD